MTLPTPVHAFIFEGHHPELADDVIFGPPCTSRVVRAAERLSLLAPIRVIRGKIIPEQLAYDLTAFVLVGGTEDTLTESSRADDLEENALISYRHASINPTTRQTATYSRSPDQDRFRTIVADLSETLSVSPSTAGTYKLLTCIGAGLPWAVSLTGLNNSQALAIDAELRSFPPYIGMAELDLGNPTHRDIMIKSMFHDDLILDARGSISRIEAGLPPDDRRDAEIEAGWIGSTGQIRLMESHEFDKVLPPLIYPDQDSERGKVSGARIAYKTRVNHRDRLIHALLDAFEKSPPTSRVEFSTALEAGVVKFHLPPAKFTEYLFNVDHPEGGGKAKVLIESLDIAPTDWRFLADQIERAMDDAPLYRVADGKWGINYGALVLVEGRNNKPMVLETGWLVESGKPARFVTAYPGSAELAVSLRAAPSFVVDPALEGDARSEAIYSRALSEAHARANAIQPTPTTSGDAIDWEGEVGSADVVVGTLDGALADWLLRKSLAELHCDTCVVPVFNCRSLARNRAFAEGLVEVFKANGVVAEVRTQAD